MYFKFKSNAKKFSYILHKNPNSPPYESDLSCGKVIGKFLNENEYEISIIQDNLKFLKTAKQLNLDTYLNFEFTSVCPYNLKSLYDCLRSVIRGTTNTSEETMTNDEFLEKTYHSCVIGPIVNSYDFVKEMFESFDLTVEKEYVNDGISNFETTFVLNIKNNTECSLSEFLQKVYVISLYVSFDRKSIFNIDENTIEKLVFLSKNWLFDSPKFNMIINKFCKNNPKFKEKFYNIIKDLDNNEDEYKIEEINKKISLHEKRHNILIEKLKDISCSTMIDLCSSEGKLLEKVNKSYPDIRITGFEKDFYKIKKFSDLTNVKMIESNILYPKISHSDILPDLLTCVEAIEHFEHTDRIKILEMIRDVIVPNYLYITTPNVEFNKFYNLNGKYRRRDHMIEYDSEQFNNEIVKYLSQSYDIECINIIEPTEEFENLQPSFCIFCTHKSISKEKNLIEISKPYPVKQGETEVKYLTIKVDKTEWNAQRIEDWYNDSTDYRRPARVNKNRQVDYKKLNKIISMQGEVFLPNCGYNVNIRELNAGYTSFNFIRNSNNIFYVAPTISPVESLYPSENELDKKYGAYDQYIEHPLSAFKYYQKRGMNKLICQTKYMGSRAQILWFESKEVANKFGFDETVIVNSRGGYKFFDGEDAKLYHNYIDQDIRKNKEKLNNIGYDFDTLILDAEILPWSYKAKELINRQFRAPIESYITLNSLKSEPTDYIKTVLDTLNTFSKETPVEIHPFHVLLCANSNEMGNIKHGYHLNNMQMMDIIKILSTDASIIKPCGYHTVDLYDGDSKLASVQTWLTMCGKSPNETIDIQCNDELIEGFVYKPINFENYLPSGYYLQPALKVRGHNYLNLTYGINLYNDEKYFNQIKNRRVSKKRMQAVQEFEMSKYILNAFIHQKDNIRLKYIAAFFGMESMTSVDKTL